MECGDRARVTHTCSRAAEVDRPLPLRGEAACGMGRRGDGGAKAQPERSMTRLRANSFRGSRKAMSSKRPVPDLHGSSARHAAADISFEMFARRRIAAAPAADRAVSVERRKAMRFRCPHAIGDGSDDNHVAPRGAPSPLIGVMRTRTRLASRAGTLTLVKISHGWRSNWSRNDAIKILQTFYAIFRRPGDNLSATRQIKRRWPGSGFCEKLTPGRTIARGSLVAFSISTG